jgi:hypothetical protein
VPSEYEVGDLALDFGPRGFVSSSPRRVGLVSPRALERLLVSPPNTATSTSPKTSSTSALTGRGAYFVTFARGADGAVYGLTASAERTNGGVGLVGLDSSYRQTSVVDLPDEGVPTYGGAGLVIDQAGVLYLALQTADFAGRLHAIQTGSPGLALTALATARTDAAGTGWAH